MSFLITDKNITDALFILNNLRDEDREEVSLIYGEDWLKKALSSSMSSDFSIMKIITHKGTRPFAMGGVCPLEGNPKIGCVWLLSTPEVQQHQIPLLRTLKRYTEEFDSEFDLTYNYIYKKNHLAKNWLKWLGYRFDNPHPTWAEYSDDFEYFYRLRKDNILCA